MYLQVTANAFGALAHDRDADVPSTSICDDGSRIEPYAVVAHRDVPDIGFSPETHVSRLGLGVFADVRERFLNDPYDLKLDAVGHDQIAFDDDADILVHVKPQVREGPRKLRVVAL